jgi:hypothetical protein
MPGVCENDRHLAEVLRTPRARGSSLAVLLAALIALAGCGEEEPYDAREFVDEVRAEGVNLILGEELFSDEEGQELYALELEPVADLPGEGGEHERIGGSISVYDDAADADGKFESCRATADLLCYQAANVVVVLEGGGIEAQQLGVAMQRLSED